MTDEYEIAVAVGAVGDQCAYTICVTRGEQHKVLGPWIVDEGGGMAADVWAATYDGIARAARLTLRADVPRCIVVVLLGAVQTLQRDAVGDGRPMVAAAARALKESGATLRWARRHESTAMTAAHEALAEAGQRAMREEIGL